MKRKINKKTISAGLIIAVLCLTIGFAVLNSNLDITGTVTAKGNSFEVEFDNVQVKDGSVTASTPSITNKTHVSVSATLNNPGDFYEFTVDVVNKGTIDAMINTITINTLTEAQKKYLDYKVTYDNDCTIGQYDKLVASPGKRTLKISLAYKSDVDAANLPTTDASIDISVEIEYVQADENAHEPVCYKIVTSSNGNWIATYKCDNDGTGRMVQCAYKDGTVCNGGKENVSSTQLCTLNASYANYLYGYCNTSLPDIRVNGGGMGTIRC